MNYVKEDLERVIITISSMIDRLEKIHNKFHEGSSHYALVRNRIKALNISHSLINNILMNESKELKYTLDELQNSIVSITSTIKKCEKVEMKLKEGSYQLRLTKNMLEALNISKQLIMSEINKSTIK